ncbi:MAG: biotin carboxylase N-terminal domain-containing protein [Pseudomonadota bacterium]
MFGTVLIANRGAIAVRVARTLSAMGIKSVGIYAESDRDSLHLSAVDHAISLGEGRANNTYLDQDKLLAIIDSENVDAVHPGYGFLSENAGFAEKLEHAGIAFIGPKPEHLRQFGLKHEARDAALAAGVNLLPGSELLLSLEDAQTSASEIGYPVISCQRLCHKWFGCRCTKGGTL